MEVVYKNEKINCIVRISLSIYFIFYIIDGICCLYMGKFKFREVRKLFEILLLLRYRVRILNGFF